MLYANKNQNTALDFNKEWKFITSETHKTKPTKTNATEREILFVMQVLLSRSEKKNYLNLKKLYLAKIDNDFVMLSF